MTGSESTRRDFIKSGVAGAFLAVSGTLDSRAQQIKAASSNKAANSRSVPGTIIRSDMSKCLPANNLSRTFEKDKWNLVEYETAEGVKGFMAYARPDERCGELRLPLDAKGIYRIYIGIVQN